MATQNANRAPKPGQVAFRHFATLDAMLLSMGRLPTYDEFAAACSEGDKENSIRGSYQDWKLRYPTEVQPAKKKPSNMVGGYDITVRFNYKDGTDADLTSVYCTPYSKETGKPLGEPLPVSASENYPGYLEWMIRQMGRGMFDKEQLSVSKFRES